jgi:carbon-monoxide dehydrogenase iron sulfur subunit
MTKMLVVDAERCMACKSCMIACAMVHTEVATLAEAVQLELPPQARGHIEPFGRFGMLVQCRHCEDAACMTVCPADAIRRPEKDGPLLIDQEKCTGCRFCLIVCPTGSIDRARKGKAMIKCDLCVTRTEVGEDPACVAACPTHGLQFRELDDWLRQLRQKDEARVGLNRVEAGPEVYPIGDLSSTDDGAPQEKEKPKPRLLPCEVCGRPVAPAKLFDRIRSKLPDDVILQPICEECRRSRTVATLSEIGPHEPGCDSGEPINK